MKFHRSFYKPFLFVILFISSAQGQWKMLHDFGEQIYSIHFLDREGFPQTGFVGLPNGEVWRTSDGGATWAQTITPAVLIGAIEDFSFKDSLTGWLCARQANISPGCFKTTDGGLTWNALTPMGSCMSVYYNLQSHALILTAWAPSVALVSNDFGVTWAPTGNNSNTCGIAFTDSLHGLMSIFAANIGGTYSSTTDGGLTWTALTQTLEAWQPLAIKGTSTYFTCAEGARQVLRSDDRGKTWSVLHTFPATLDLSGDIRGDLSAMYIQGKPGTFFSVDQGITWTDYCGPKNDFDTRMYNLGPDSLYAGTTDGQLWLNPFGVRKNSQLLKFPSSFDLVSGACAKADSLFIFTSLSNCLQVKLLSLAIVPGTGSKTFSFKIPVYPVTFADTAKDSVKITYTPDNSTTDSAQFEIKYSVGPEIFTSRIWLRGFVKPGYNVALSKDLSVFLESFCGQIDTFVTVTAGLCGADTLLNVKVSDPTAFSVNPAALPAAIPAGGSLRIPLSITSALNPGTYNAILTLTIRSGGVTKDTTINLSDFILSPSEPRTNLTPGIAKFDTVSICNQLSDTIILKNTLCNTLSLNSIGIQPASIASEFAVSVLNKTLPNSVAPKGFDTIIITYKPTVGATIAGSVVLNISLSSINRDTLIPLTAIGKALAGSSLASNLLNFPDNVPCTTQELSTQLYNTSCNSDTIVSIIPSSDKSFSVLAPSTPTTIISGDSALIKIQEDPLSPGAKFDSVRVVIHSSAGAIDTVNLKVSGIVNKPSHVLNLISLLQLDSLAPCTPLDTTLQIKNLGTCDTIIINSIDLTGANWITFQNTLLPFKILPGTSFSYTLHLSPGAKANGTSTIHIVGNGIDTVVTVNANSRSGGALLSVTADSVFASSFCKPDVHTFTLQNTSCDPITFDALSLKNILGNQFTFIPNITPPLTIQPGGKQDIIISFDPSAVGDSLAKFSYQSTASGISRTIGLKGSLSTTKQTAHLELVIAPNLKVITLPAQSIVTVRILLQDNIDPSLGFQSVTTSLRYLDDVLGMPNTTASAGWKLNSSNPTKGNVALDLSRTDNNPITAGAEIATVQFLTYVAPSAFTPLNLESITLNPSDLNFQSCVLTPLALDTISISVGECGSEALRSYLNNPNIVFTNISVKPNPVSSGSQINVNLQLHQRSDLNITLRDVLGQTVSDITKPSREKGIQDISLDLPKGASGVYILSIEAGGMRESRKIVVRK